MTGRVPERPITAWRITKRRWAEQAFDGEGARRYGGRWNSPGSRMVYVAQSRSLAILELLVHLGDARTLVDSYVLLEVTFPTSVTMWVDVADLPPDWAATPAPAALATLGDRWLENGRSAALMVPSAVCPGEHNWLLAPGHRDFRRIRVGKPQRLQLEARLLR